MKRHIEKNTRVGNGICLQKTEKTLGRCDNSSFLKCNESLSKDPTVHCGASLEGDGCFSEKDTLEVRASSGLDCAGDGPDDVLRKTTNEDDLLSGGNGEST